MKMLAMRGRQIGLSLVEMMIALTLGAIVSVGVIQLFSANSDTYDLMQGQSRMQESARFALLTIARSAEQAGYKGCYSTTNSVYSTVTVANIPYEFNIIRGMQGYDGQMAGGWIPDPTAEFGTPFISGNQIDLSKIVTGTDILTIRSASQDQADLVSDMPTSTEPIYVKVPSSGLGFALNDLAIIHDCEESTIFRVTGITMDSPAAGDATIGHDTSDVDATRNTFLKLGQENTYSKDAAVSAIMTTTFFIAPGSGVNNVGDTPLALWRKYGTAAPVELVEGVEDLQLLYGLDSDGDGTPDTYVKANLVPSADFSKVVSLRISISVNSVDDVGAFQSKPPLGCISAGGQQKCINGGPYDGLARRTFHQTVQLRNQG